MTTILPVSDNYNSLWHRFTYSCCFTLFCTVPNPLAHPFGGAEAWAPPGAQAVAEPKGWAGAPGQLPPFSLGRATR